MKYIEYGKQNSEVIILLHGGGLSWWNYREVAQQLIDDYHVILPILDGHANSDQDFTSIEQNALAIIQWIEQHHAGKVLMIGGVSLGAQIALEILSQRPLICQYALIESANVIPSKWIHSMIGPAFGCSYPLIHQKWFAKLQFQSLRIKESLFEDYFQDTCGITKENLIAFMQGSTMYSMKDSLKNTSARVHIFVGEREQRGMLKSASLIHEKIKGSSLHILPGMYHGEFSMNYAKDYVETIRNILNK